VVTGRFLATPVRGDFPICLRVLLRGAVAGWRIPGSPIRCSAARREACSLRSSAIRTLFQGSLSDEELEKILDSLKKRGVVAEHDGKVVYALPESAG